MAASLNRRAGSVAGPERYWAPCAAVALLAMFLFYVTLQHLVRESAARAPLSVGVMPAHIEMQTPPAMDERALKAPSQPMPPGRTYSPALVSAQQVPVARTVRPLEVNKCVTASGESEYSDGPCPVGAQATRLRLRLD
ncbi:MULTISPECIES: hypothetical protein [unclassified Variovorax]|jgi:hypothetical protein|uniref:hypothetical protein n=1 Tax=unclassified Variovorax TaxID=663243 RepID=UPI00086B35CD|nr:MULTISPECIES: hypothetical protein [unclassified Variovorax]MBN8754555.1 hypothetical protein [Variovorax sp.]ODU19284.1 MAG: hypothetical protein ABS94_00025 [Variovorax sp. SCN 67-85]ODV25187.1 MAG: hypothetical protein ABT25_10365 [Variovorax sp. SCN 67-20]OJZ03005.1 MAG: hypothetical protein BGP22_00020 [Variovorax sp. 67-131]